MNKHVAMAQHEARYLAVLIERQVKCLKRLAKELNKMDDKPPLKKTGRPNEV